MDFDISEEQQQLADAVKRFLDKEYDFEARMRILKSPGAMSESAWQSYAELGLLALPLAEEHGGFGGGAADLMPVMEAMGAARKLDRSRTFTSLSAPFRSSDFPGMPIPRNIRMYVHYGRRHTARQDIARPVPVHLKSSAHASPFPARKHRPR